MKTNILLAVAVIGIMGASCRKERTCTCKTTATAVTSTNNGPVTNVYTTSETFTKEKQYKNDFRREELCYSRQYTELSDGGNTQTTYVVDCDLK